MKWIMISVFLAFPIGGAMAQASPDDPLNANCSALRVFNTSPDLFTRDAQSFYAGFYAGSRSYGFTRTEIMIEYANVCNARTSFTVGQAMQRAVANSIKAAPK